MAANYLVLKSASYRIDQIYIYTLETWGEGQARKYIEGLFDCFQDIADHKVVWRPIPAAFEVIGYFTRYEKHYIYWKELDNGDVGIAAILHERMNLGDRLAEDLGLD